MVFRWFFALLTLISFPMTAHGQEEASIRSRLEALKIPFSEEAFLEEIREGNAETVSLFLEGGMGPNVLDSNGRSALVWAAGNGHAAIVKLLLQNKADLCGGGSQSPLLWAAANGRREAAAALLGAGARACEQDKTQITSVVAAAQNGYVDTVELFLEETADVTEGEKISALERAAANGHLDVIHLLLHHRVAADAKTAPEFNPVGSAAFRGHTEIVKFFLDRGADPNGPVPVYGTPLGAAAGGGHLQTAKLLLERGATPTATALRSAAQGGHLEIARLLLDKGVDVNVVDADKTPLIAAIAGRKTNMLPLLIERGADLNAGVGFVEPPLLLAAQSSEAEMVRLLLKGGRTATSGEETGAPR
ncbi:MAG: ankyrin repeat domain-containing protein [Candidatus Manganitrophus sp.]|nr:ankyrin repeat domain-containing protein [Candidatus Manganitrophus sp.]